LTISGQDLYGVIEVKKQLTVSMSNLILTNGNGKSETGGGINCDSSSLRLNGVIIRNCTATDGGGIFCENSPLSLTDVEISNNAAMSSGGGICLMGGDHTLHSVKIKYNKAGWGGGIYTEDHESINLKDVAISHNTAFYGQIYSQGGGIWIGGSPNLIFDNEERCNIYINKSISGSDIFFSGPSGSISVVVDTFTVLSPTDDYAQPIQSFSFDILHDASGIPNLIEKTNTIPLKFILYQNYPNPFNPATMINYQLPMTSDVDISIYNLLGQKVWTLLNERKQAGYHQVKWDASGFASGIYYYRIEAGEFRDVKKMILLR
jgi:hypothetical protein